MSSIQEQLLKILRNGSRSDLVSFIEQQDNNNKKLIVRYAAVEVRQALHEYNNTGRTDTASKYCTNDLLERQELGKIAVFAYSTMEQHKNYYFDLVLSGESLLFAVEHFKPKWIDQWVDHMLSDRGCLFIEIRQLLNAGLIATPASDPYALGFISEGLYIGGTDPSESKSIEQYADDLEQQGDVMDDLIWRLFEVDATGRNSLAAVRDSKTWQAVLLELSDRDKTRRARFLDASLEALGRGFSQYTANWFSQFHEALRPSIDERQARTITYLQLLTSNSANTVSFALKSLQLLNTKATLNPEALIEHIRPAMQAKAKSNIKIAVKLINTAIKNEQTLTSQALSILIDGFIHESKDVHALILKSLKANKSNLNHEHREELQLYADAIPTSLALEFEDLTGVRKSECHIPDSTNTSAVSTELNQISNFTDTLHQYLSILENPNNPANIELLLDGICRLSPLKSDNENDLLSALTKRAKSIVKTAQARNGLASEVDHVRVQLASLAISLTEVWSAPTKPLKMSVLLSRVHDPFTKFGLQGLPDIFHARNVRILELVKLNRGLPLLCTPTNDDFYIDGEVLVQRLALYNDLGIELDNTDLTLALMRLDPVDREHVYNNIPKSTYNTQLMAHIKTPPTAVSFDLKSYRGVHNLTMPITPARYEIKADCFVDYFRFNVADDGHSLSLNGHVNSIRWYSTIWPTNNEAFFAIALNNFHAYQKLANSPYQAYFEIMLRPSFVPYECGSVMLMQGIGSRDPSIQTLAADAFINNALKGSLNIAMLGEYASDIYPNITPISRFTKALKQIGEVSPTLSGTVQQLISDTLRYDPSAPPRNVAGLMELLHELALRDGVLFDSANSIDFLTQVKPSSSAGKAASKLLLQLQRLAS